MAALDLALLLAAAPAIAIAALRIALAFGVVDPVDLPAAALSPEPLAAAAVLALAVLGSSAAISLRRIARDTRAIALLGRSRDPLAPTGPEAAIVDFAIHLDRRPSVDLTRSAGTSEEVPAGTTAPHPLAPSRTLSELKSRLAHIPSVRGSAGRAGS